MTILDDSERYYKGSIIVFVLFFTSLWAVKLAFLLFFRRLGRNVKSQNVIWWSVFVVTFSSYFVCIGTIQYICLGAPVMEIVQRCSQPGPVKFVQDTVKAGCALDVITDYMSRFFCQVSHREGDVSF